MPEFQIIAKSFVPFHFYCISLVSGEYDRIIQPTFDIEKQFLLVSIDIAVAEKNFIPESNMESIERFVMPIEDKTLIIEGDYQANDIQLLIPENSIEVEIFNSMEDNTFLLVIYNVNPVPTLVKEYFFSGLKGELLLCKITKDGDIKEYPFYLKRKGEWLNEEEDDDEEMTKPLVNFHIAYETEFPKNDKNIFIENFDSIEFSGFFNGGVKTIYKTKDNQNACLLFDNSHADENCLFVYVS